MTDQPLIDPAPPAAAGAPPENPLSVAQIAAQIEQETLQRAAAEGAARLALPARLDMPAPGGEPAPSPGLVERLAQRIEQEAVARGADEWATFHPSIDDPNQENLPENTPGGVS